MKEYGNFVRVMGHSKPKEELKQMMYTAIDSMFETLDELKLSYIRDIKFVISESLLPEFPHEPVTNVGWQIGEPEKQYRVLEPVQVVISPLESYLRTLKRQGFSYKYVLQLGRLHRFRGHEGAETLNREATLDYKNFHAVAKAVFSIDEDE